MQEKSLLKIALIFSLLGIVLLFFISERVSVRSVNVRDAADGEAGKILKITGRIERISDTGKVVFMEIGQEKVETISVVLFKDSQISLNKGDNVEITGEVTEYNGKNEIIANKIRII